MRVIQEEKAQDRPGWSHWLPVLGGIIVFVSLGFAAVVLGRVNQPEATTPVVVGTATLSAISSPTVEEASAPVLETPTPGLLAPDFTLPDLDGTMWSLSQFRGRPVVLFFWATW